MTKKILILSYYFEPDIGPGAYRTKGLVDELSKNNVDIDIFTTAPARYDSYDVKVNEEENYSIKRVNVGSHHNSTINQAMSYSKFATLALVFAKNKKYDIVYATSSRLFTGILGALMSKLTGAKLILDVRDLFLENIEITLDGLKLKLFKRLFSYLERFAFRNSEYIFLASEGFEEYFIKNYPYIETTTYRNGLDEIFSNYDYSRNRCINEKVKVLYAGNIGQAQALDTLIPNLAESLSDSHEFTIIGDGSSINELKQAVKNLSNVKILRPVERIKLLEYYKNSDVLLLNLKGAKCFEVVIPSKIFEYCATGKPILAGVSGVARSILTNEVKGAYVFEPSNSLDALKKLVNIQIEYIDRKDTIIKFSRKNISTNMANSIMDKV